jgi:hypothetical protein
MLQLDQWRFTSEEDKEGIVQEGDIPRTYAVG